jgi:hypothetical protein
MCTFLLYCYVCSFIVQYVILLSCMFVLLLLCLFFVLYGCFLFFLFLVIVLYVCFIVFSPSSYLVFVFFVLVNWTLPPGRNPIAVNNNNKGKAVPQHTYGGAGRRCIAPTHSRPRHLMGVSGQHHAPAAIYPREMDLPYPLDRRLGGPQSRSGHEKKILLPLPGIEPRSPGRLVRSQTLYWLSYPGSFLFELQTEFSDILHELWLQRVNTDSERPLHRGVE